MMSWLGCFCLSVQSKHVIDSADVGSRITGVINRMLICILMMMMMMMTTTTTMMMIIIIIINIITTGMTMVMLMLKKMTTTRMIFPTESSTSFRLNEFNLVLNKQLFSRITTYIKKILSY